MADRRKLIPALLLAVALCPLAACVKPESNKPPLSANPSIGGNADGILPGGKGAVIGIKDALNPLTGEYDLARERAGKPVFVVNVDNIQFARPQSGISKADVIFETLTEGGITRLSCLYSDLREVEKIGDLRSIRDQNLEAAAYLDPLFIHWGTAVCSEYLLKQYPRLMSLDCAYVPMLRDILMVQDKSRYEKGYAQEYTWFIDGTRIDEALWAVGAGEIVSRSNITAFDFRKPEEPASVPVGGEAKRVTFLFSENPFMADYEYDGDFRYDDAGGEYLKWQFGVPQTDEYYSAQLAFKNVLVLFADIGQKGEPYVLLTNLRFQSGGTGYYFSGGRYERITWGKGDLFEPYWFKDETGAPLILNPGKTYVGFSPYAFEKRLSIES